MALAVTIRAPQGGVVAAVEAITENVNLPQGIILATYNVPSAGLRAAQGGLTVVMRQQADVHVAQGIVLAAVRGRAANPRLRAWTFTLDGHDFYVLRLGDATTLVYDVYSEQWVPWDSHRFPFWRANTGMNWAGAKGLAHQYGSDIVAGDDTYGLLWFLDPDLPYDEAADFLDPAQQIEFPRIVTGQVLASGREFIPCYAIFLDGDNYGITVDDFVPSIKLETSDDEGRTFDDQGSIALAADYTAALPYEWLSLGQISKPGRIFRVTDNGVYTRIDSMEMNDDAG